MNHYEMRLMVFITKRRLQTTQDDKLVIKKFDEKISKMATEMVQILDFFLRNEF